MQRRVDIPEKGFSPNAVAVIRAADNAAGDNADNAVFPDVPDGSDGSPTSQHVRVEAGFGSLDGDGEGRGVGQANLNPNSHATWLIG